MIDSKLNSNQEEEAEEGDVDNVGGAGRGWFCCSLNHCSVVLVFGILPFHGITPVG